MTRKDACGVQMSKTERAAMAERAQVHRLASTHTTLSAMLTDFATSEVLRALRKCAKLVCERCARGEDLVGAGVGVTHPSRLGNLSLRCEAAPIHDKIVEIEKL